MLPDWLPVNPNLNYINEMQDRIAETAQREARQRRTLADAASFSLQAAQYAVESLIEQMAWFEERLEADQEIALYIVGGPAGVSFFPTSVIPINPDKVAFRGEDQDGRPFAIIQHVSQLNFAMQAARVAPEEKPRRIGFHHPEEE
ncbi:hypothetical protein GCM10011349_37470 [Novosphingobium indicum]|uniref:Uncharacterized protein n=1 Tax=Novosphingobium indicum TaxID=462949 RepID=A0ABQ2JWG3_9SPHN|nr:DUF6173 family protein [Novosphingobium indicum]GGN58153.1 hypothetical protein GCM10011349_37470 [Novosphingobium indicum]